MTQPRLLTVILNYKTPEMTMTSAEAALREMEGIAGRILIVDNDSGDGSFEAMQADLVRRGWDTSRVAIHQSGHNGGFGAGNNFGIRQGLSEGDYDYVYVLNSDAFPDPGSIRSLMDHLEANAKTGFAGSYIHGPDGDPHLTAFRFPSIRGEFEGAARIGVISRLFKNQIVPLPIPDRTIRVDWLAGASLMMRREVLEEIGLFDETFFLYFEETDLCLRAARAGWTTDYVRESEVTHIGSASTGMKTWTRMPQFWFDSRLYYLRRNHGGAYAFAATLAQISGLVLNRLRRWIERKPSPDPDRFMRDLIAHYLKNSLQPKPRERTKVPKLPFSAEPVRGGDLP